MKPIALGSSSGRSIAVSDFAIPALSSRAFPSANLGLSIAAKTGDARLRTLDCTRIKVTSSLEPSFNTRSPAGSQSFEGAMVVLLIQVDVLSRTERKWNGIVKLH